MNPLNTPWPRALYDSSVIASHRDANSIWMDVSHKIHTLFFGAAIEIDKHVHVFFACLFIKNLITSTRGALALVRVGGSRHGLQRVTLAVGRCLRHSVRLQNTYHNVQQTKKNYHMKWSRCPVLCPNT